MTKAWLALVALGLVAPENNAEKLMKDAQYTLPASIDKAGKDLKDVTPVSAWLRQVNGRTQYTVRFAQGETTLKISLDAKTGEVIEKVTEKRNRTKAISLSKTSVAQAIEIALAKVPGQAYRVTLCSGKTRAIYEVMVLAGGKIKEVEIDAATGKVLDVEDEDDDDDDDEDEDDDEEDDDEDEDDDD